MNIVISLIVAGMFAGSAYFYPQLPTQLPTHWNIAGNIDGYMDKMYGAWLFPFLTLAMFFSFKVIPFLDPKKDKYKLFQHEWIIIQTAFIAFFAYMHFVVLHASLFPRTNSVPLIFIGLGSLFILIGNYLSKIRQNYFIGIRVPWTLSNEENWNKTHRFASWCFVTAGIVVLLESYFQWYSPIVVLSSLGIASLAPMAYSFILYRKNK
ncbi:SdpI family protein [Candidatus Roizmanbacteria bacterium]|nr:SdpI family protein [Candidatus Roizmanbacteria bacterium]